MDFWPLLDAHGGAETMALATGSLKSVTFWFVCDLERLVSTLKELEQHAVSRLETIRVRETQTDQPSIAELEEWCQDRRIVLDWE